ncbi:hypothetical protein BDR07DRAFT_1382245 [Suillus spraguei]|nr:hypothetical protein BDR07DRAFT_1382245 [Suillus spraguei]
MVKSWEVDKTQENPFINRECGISEADVHVPNLLSKRRLLLSKDNFTITTYPQALYMVNLENLLEQNDSGSFVEAENTILWSPSSINTSIWTSTCHDNIICIEEELCNAQCHDCLNKLRNVLCARVHLIKHRNRNTRAQRVNTHAASVISRLDAKIKIIAEKYRTTHSKWTKWTKKQQAAANRRLGQGVMQVSWIWTSVGVLGDDKDVGLNDASQSIIEDDEDVVIDDETYEDDTEDDMED